MPDGLLAWPPALDTLDGLVADARLGEVIEAFARVVAMHVVVRTGQGALSTQELVTASVDVVSHAEGRAGAASTDGLDHGTLREALGDARRARTACDLPAPPPSPTVAAPGFVSVTDAPSELERLDAFARELAADDVRVTVGETSRHVRRTLSVQGGASYATREVQTHLVVTSGAAAGAQTATVTRSLAEVDVAALRHALDDARRRRTAGGAAPAGSGGSSSADPGAAVEWVLLAPRAAARLLSWVVPVLATLEVAGVAPGTRVGELGLAIVDDQSSDHPNGHAFDDLGIPGRVVELVSGGVFRTGLRASPVGEESTSSAVRGENLTAAAAFCRLSPTTERLVVPRGRGLVVDELSVLHGVADVAAEAAMFELRGTTTGADAAEAPARYLWSATVLDVLAAVREVEKESRTYRYRGLYGGARTILRPDPGRLKPYVTASRRLAGE